MGATHGGAPVVDPELGVDVLRVRADRAQGDGELASDGRPVEVGPEKAHHLELSLAERLDVRGSWFIGGYRRADRGRRRTGGRTQFSQEAAVAFEGSHRVEQAAQTHGVIGEDTDPPLRSSQVHRSPQGVQRPVALARGVAGQRREDGHLDGGSDPPTGLGGPLESFEEVKGVGQRPGSKDCVCSANRILTSVICSYSLA